MKFRELIAYLDEAYPKTLSMPGDVDGVDVCVDYNTQIGGVLLALDVTLSAIEYARTHGFNCILSHHAMIYSPIKKLDSDLGNAARKAAMLARYDICAAAFHTRLDAVAGGVNDCLLSAISMKNAEPLICNDVPIGRICTFDEDYKEISIADFTDHVDKSLKAFYKTHFDFELSGRRARFNLTNGEHKIKKLAAVGGHGMGFIAEAANAGADTFLTGEGKYHDFLEAREAYNINVIIAGHFETEAVVLPEIKRAVLAKFPSTRVEYFIDDCACLV